jgi:putative ABC transport system permease protein
MTVRLIARNLFRAPGFAALVVVTLAIGIGATTAMFSVVDAVLLRPLRFAGADRAVEVWMRSAEGASAQPGLTVNTFAEVRRALDEVADVEGYQFGSGTVTGGAEPVIVSVPSVTPDLFHLVGATAIVGRVFTAEDAAPGVTSVLISEALWTSQFGRDPGVLARRITLDGQAHTVVGVLSSRIRYPEARAMVWRALDPAVTSQPRRRIQALVVPKPDVSMDELRARLSAVTLSLQEQGTLTAGQSLLFDDVIQVRVARSRGRPLWLMLGAVGLVLLIACANVMNLLLMRASSRRGELAVLSAIGASRLALLRHVGMEVLLLTALGLAAGVVLAAALVRAASAIVPPELDILASTSPDVNWRVIAFACGVAGIVSLLAGLVPVWRSSRVDAVDGMKWQSHTVTGVRDERWQAAMLAVQIGTVVVLVAGTGLLLRSFVKLTAVDPGYDAEALISALIQPTAPRYREASVVLGTMQDLERRVEDAGLGPAAFTAGAPIPFEIRPEGEGGLPVDATGMVLPFSPVSPDYFETMGIPVLQGRAFAPDDGPDVIVVNDRLASAFWGEQSPIGRRFRLDADQPWRTIVGVVGDVRMLGLDDPTKHGMEFYTPHSRTRASGYYFLIVRSPLQTSVVISGIKQLLWSIDPGVPIVEAGSMRDSLLESLYRQRFVVRLSTMFATMAILLAGVGIYGVAAYWVARRRRELAIRVALGATGRHVLRRVVSRAAAVGAAGGVLGAAGSIASGRVLQSSVYETGAADLLVVLGTVVLMVVLIVLACLVPARSALSVDPATILREE